MKMGKKRENRNPISEFLKGTRFVVLFFLVVGAAFFLSYGRWDWWEAWFLIGMWALYFGLMLTVTRKHNPGVVKERSESLSKFSQKWDKLIIGLYQVSSLSLYIIAGLDVGRYGWTSRFPAWLKWCAFPLVLIVYVVPYWAVLSNPFASGVVRIQEEREHKVNVSGPYQFVRHPMYLGTVIYSFAFPLFLESYWALLPGTIVLVLFVIRTTLEDKYLKLKLSGYKEYAQQVRYRLLPGIW